MVRKNYSEEQEKMARFAKAMGHPAHTSIFGLAGMLLFWRHS